MDSRFDMIEFLAEETLVDVVPRVNHDPLQFVAGHFGPFLPSQRIPVPLWLATDMGSQNQSDVALPEWFSRLDEYKQLETSKDAFAPRPHWHFQTVVSLLGDDAHKDLEADISTLRTSKIRRGLVDLARSKQVVSSLNMTHVTALEAASLRYQVVVCAANFYMFKQATRASSAQPKTRHHKRLRTTRFSKPTA